MSHARNRFSILVLLLLIAFPVFSQIRIASPYSRFGIGDLSTNNNAWNSSMGGITFGMRNPSHINWINPAALTAFDSLSFLFEGGFNIDLVTLTTSVDRSNNTYASISYLLFGMPVTRWWKTSLGLVPFSDVGYNIATYEQLTEGGNVTRLYQGSGGMNRVYWANGFRIFKNLSIGINASYLFGSMNRDAIVIFPDSVHYANFKVQNYITIGDIYFTYGIQYHKKLKNDLSIVAGVVFSPETKINAKADAIASTFFLGASGTEYPKDTIFNAEGYKGKIVIPLFIGGGLSFGKANKWTAGVDGQWQNWKQFTAFGLTDSLINSFQVGAGAEIIPNFENYNKYFSRINYRIGLFYSRTYLQLRNTNLNEYGISLGFGLPLKGNKTMLQIGSQASFRGTTNHDLIRESSIRIFIGFSINEKWFMKRKYY